MVCLDYKGSSVLVEVELKLSNFLKHKHPIETVDYIVCWHVDLEEYKIHKINDIIQSTLINRNILLVSIFSSLYTNFFPIL